MELRRATGEECRARDVLTYQAWGAGLTKAQYQERELVLRGHPWAREEMATWVLADGATILASCETFRIPSRVGSSSGTSWAVASVFVERALRGQGLALHLMRKLQKYLAEEPSAHAVVLFSEVDAQIYARAGFVEIPSWSSSFPPLAGRSDQGDELEWLDQLPSPEPAVGKAQTLILEPTGGQADWHVERERYYQRTLGLPALRCHGARYRGSAIAWTAAHKVHELHVLWVSLVRAEHLAPLIAAARQVAADAQLSAVRVWEVGPPIDLPQAVRSRRQDSVAMYAPLHPEVRGWEGVHRVFWV